MATEAIGWPDSTNTGVAAGTVLTQHYGDLIITTPGAVISNLDIHGTVYINAPNVTLENCNITAANYVVVRVQNGVQGVTVQDCTINGSGTNNDGSAGIQGTGTFLRNNIFNVENGITVDDSGKSTLIEGNYIHDLRASGSPHYDGIQIDGNISNVTISHNTIINSHDQTSAIMIDNYFGPISNIVVDNNLLVGGGYTVYADGQFSGGSITGVSFTNNHLGSGTWGYTSFNKNSPVYTGNVNDGAALTKLLNTAGNTGGDTGTSTPVSAPHIDGFSGDTGKVGDGVTSDNTVTLKGSAVANSTVKILDGSTQIGSVKTDASGAWSFTTSAVSDGIHKFTATATSGGTTSAASASLSVTVDTVAPGAPSVKATLSNSGSSVVANITGTAEANGTVKVYDGTAQIGTATAGSSGAWTFTTTGLAAGNHSFSAKAMDAAGNTGGASAAVPITVSNPTSPPTSTKPDAPVIASFSEDSGVKGDGVTNDNTIALTGTAAAGSTVKIYDGATQIGTAKAAANGSWSYITSVLTDAKHALTATATNSSGQVSSASAAVAITVDTKAPDAPTISTGTLTNARTAAGTQSVSVADGAMVNLKGTAEARSTVAIYDGNTKIGAVVAGADGAWAFSTDSLSAGQHSLTARATDVAGNVGAVSAVLQVGVTAPAPVPPSAPRIASFSNDTGKVGDGITSDNTLHLDGTAAGNSKVTIYDGMQKLGTAMSDDNGAWSFTTAALNDGSHNLTAKVTDGTGQTGAASSVTKVTIDTHAPNAPTLGIFSPDGKALNGPTTVDDVVLKGTAEANSVVKLYDAGKLIGSSTAKSDGTWSFDTGHLSDGGHKFAATASDLAGNAGVASATKAISVIDAPVSSAGIDLTSVYQGAHNAVTLQGTADAYSQIRIFDGSKAVGTVKANADGDWSYSAWGVSSNSVHTFSAKELDKAGQVVSSSGNAILGICSANTLKGTSADDTFIGNGHPDTFVFAPNFGNDTIKDFRAGGPSHDVVQFSKSMFDNFADVLSHATQSGQDVVIASGHDTLTLKDTKIGALDKSDFHFA